MSDEQDTSPEGVGWYISDTHARRAIGYLSGQPELGNIEVPVLADLWAKALEATIAPEDPSPIGPEPRLAAWNVAAAAASLLPTEGSE